MREGVNTNHLKAETLATVAELSASISRIRDLQTRSKLNKTLGLVDPELETPITLGAALTALCQLISERADTVLASERSAAEDNYLFARQVLGSNISLSGSSADIKKVTDEIARSSTRRLGLSSLTGEEVIRDSISSQPDRSKIEAAVIKAFRTADNYRKVTGNPREIGSAEDRRVLQEMKHQFDQRLESLHDQWRRESVQTSHTSSARGRGEGQQSAAA